MRSQGIWWARLRGLGVAAVASLLLASCGSASSTGRDAAGTGGATAGSGGGTATGGAAAGSGGAMGTGGATETGGATATGGATETGGAAAGSGGGAGAGGAVASGGAGTAGGGQGGAPMATGGRSGSGGVVGTGGAASGGTDGGLDAPADAGTGGSSDAAAEIAPNDSMPSSAGAVDVVFLVDDSASMQPLQAKLAQAFSGFMNTLEALPGGLPSLHIAVVSSSLGAGVFGNVTGCAPGTEGNKGGAFLHPAACTALPASERFLIADGPTKNFAGDISDVFGCLAMIGASGCGFEHQFEATRQALVKAQTPGDPDNAGFLRPNAHLAIIMLTNEDDCSAPADSMLFDPNQQTVADPVGGLQSYRCNEFGHLCNGGVAPPHAPPATPVTLTGCVPAESQGRLTLVSDFVAFLRSVKPSTSKVFVAAMAGPVTPYVVESKMFMLGNGGMEFQPSVQHSCTNATATYADPAVRIKSWVDAFGANGVFESLCPDDLGPPMMRIAQALAAAIQ